MSTVTQQDREYEVREQLHILYPVVALARELRDRDPDGWRVLAFRETVQSAHAALADYLTAEAYRPCEADAELQQARAHLTALSVLAIEANQGYAGIPAGDVIDAITRLADEMRDRWCRPENQTDTEADAIADSLLREHYAREAN
jgi:hypothetical protein